MTFLVWPQNEVIATGPFDMTHIIIAPGPVVQIWRDGAKVWEIPLDRSAALSIIADLAKHVRNAQRQQPIHTG